MVHKEEYISRRKFLKNIAIFGGSLVLGALLGKYVTSNIASNLDTIVLRYPEDGEFPHTKTIYNGEEIAAEICMWNLYKADGHGIMILDTKKGIIHYEQNLRNLVKRKKDINVYGYPEVYYGTKPWTGFGTQSNKVEFPVNVGDTKNISVQIHYQFEHEPDLPTNFAFDSWITRDKNARTVGKDDVEIMIWWYYTMPSAGQKERIVNIPVKINNVTKNIPFEVWIGDLGWNYVAFRSTRLINTGKIEIPYGAFIDLAFRMLGLPKRDYYLRDIEIGSEFGSTSRNTANLNWTIYNFKVQRS